MIYFVEHNVCVVPRNGGNSDSQSEYAVTSEDSFKHMYAVAYFFKGFVEKFIGESDFQSNRLLPAKDLKIHGINWAGLCGASFGRDIGWGNVVFTRKEYDNQNFGANIYGGASGRSQSQ